MNPRDPAGRGAVPFGGRVLEIATVLLLAFAFAHGQEEMPTLPFDDNPDPDRCGIPVALGEEMTAEISGEWEGELLYEDVHLYDSHLRSEVTGTVPHGAEVDVRMFQDNPVLNYWYVHWDGPEGVVEGWLPEPFLDRDGG